MEFINNFKENSGKDLGLEKGRGGRRVYPLNSPLWYAIVDNCLNL